jgi:hypothetical protein
MTPERHDPALSHEFRPDLVYARGNVHISGDISTGPAFIVNEGGLARAVVSKIDLDPSALPFDHFLVEDTRGGERVMKCYRAMEFTGSAY